MSRNRSNDPPKSARELLAELEKDPEYKARMAARSRKRQDSLEQYRRAAKPVLEELALKGIRVGSIRELRTMQERYEEALPILMHWLPLVHESAVKEDIVRTLSLPSAAPHAAHALIREFRRTDVPADEGMRWSIGNALAIVGTDETFDDIVELLRERRYGKTREMLVLALSNMNPRRSIPVLMELLDDEELIGHAVVALGKLRAREAAQRLDTLARTHSAEWVRAEARKALALIGARKRSD